MYRLYIEHCGDKQETPAKEHAYKSVFYSEFNLYFHKPQNDLWSLCEKYKNSADAEKLN